MHKSLILQHIMKLFFFYLLPKEGEQMSLTQSSFFLEIIQE